MVDIVDTETRRRMMSGIRSGNTKPEIFIRKLLHREGFRFRIHVKHLLGKPDIVLKRFKAIIFVHGCFWHGHNCRQFKWPQTRAEFWRTKIEKNQTTGSRTVDALRKMGWRVAIIWECAVRYAINEPNNLERDLITWLHSDTPFVEIAGRDLAA